VLTSQHAIVGAVIGVATGNPVLGFAGGVASHLVLDSLPHVDNNILHTGESDFYEKIGWRDYILVGIDGLVTVGLMIFVVEKVGNIELIAFGGLGGVLPDFLDNAPWWNELFRNTVLGRFWHSLHSRWHYGKKGLNRFTIGIAVVLQLIITIGGVWALLLNF
jgi:hypothetical protein